MNINAEDRILVLRRGKDKNSWLFVFNSPPISSRFVNSLQVARLHLPTRGRHWSLHQCCCPRPHWPSRAAVRSPTHQKGFQNHALSSQLLGGYQWLPAFLSAWVCACSSRVHFMEMLLLALPFSFPSWPPCSLPEASVALGKIRVLN